MGIRPPRAALVGGLLDTLGAIGGTLGEMARVRYALLAVELREEVERRKQMLVLAVAGAIFLHTALLLLTLVVVAAFWDSYRLGAIGALAALYLACGIAAFMRLRAAAAASPEPFAASRRELAQDLAELGTTR